MRTAPRVLLLSPGMNDIVSMYRAYGPFLEMEERGLIEIKTIESGAAVDWRDFLWADIMFFNRPFDKSHLDLIRQYLVLQKPIIADFDDNYMRVPADNPTTEIYNTPQAQRSLHEILPLISKIWVSTEELKKAYEPFNPRIKVVPNGFDTRSMLARSKANETKTIVWRGSGTQQSNLDYFYPSLLEVIDKPDSPWRLLIWGPLPLDRTSWISAIQPQINHPLLPDGTPDPNFPIPPPNVTVTTAAAPRHIKVRHMPSQPTFAFYKMFVESQPEVVLIFATDTEFNRGRSHNNWIEGTVAGARVLAPDFLEYQDKPNCVLYKAGDLEDFKEKLRYILDKYSTKTQQGMDYIKEKLLLKDINMKRFEDIKELVDASPRRR